MDLKVRLLPVRYDTVVAGFQKEVYIERVPAIRRTVLTFKAFGGNLSIRADRRPRMIFEVKRLREGCGRPDWGAEPGVRYYIVTLGERLK